MKTTRQNSSLLFAVCAAASLAACAHPAPPPSVATAAPAPAPAPPPAPAAKALPSDEAAVAAANKVDIDFPEGTDKLTPEALKKLDLAARLYRDANPVVMFTAGHSDRKGNELANVMLSARRAEAVKRALVARGIPADRLLIQALGETDLADPNDPFAAQNRRVTITWRLS